VDEKRVGVCLESMQSNFWLHGADSLGSGGEAMEHGALLATYRALTLVVPGVQQRLTTVVSVSAADSSGTDEHGHARGPSVKAARSTSSESLVGVSGWVA
jgi:hypothetical protein